MKKDELKKYNQLLSKITTIQKDLGYLGDKDKLEVIISIEMDLRLEKVQVIEGNVHYQIDSDAGELLDYLTVLELKKMTSGLPILFTAYDKAREDVDFGEIMVESWETEDYFNEDIRLIKLNLKNKNDFVNGLINQSIPTTFYAEVKVTHNDIDIYLDKDSERYLDQNLPLHIQEDIVIVLKRLLQLDEKYNTRVNDIQVKPEPEKESISGNNEEFVKNIQVLKTHEAFNNLHKKGSIIEADESFLYISTNTKQAKLHRYFKGAYFNLNTVQNVPLTLTSQYEVEDKTSVVSSAHLRWATDILNGRHQRVLAQEEDYYKFVLFIENHFPSLKSKYGGLKAFDLSLGLRGGKSFKSSVNEGFNALTVYEEESGQNKIVATINFGYTIEEESKVSEEIAEEFLGEYQEFVNWLAENEEVSI